jgi:hypothetical protein
MIEAALQAEREKHMAKIEAMLERYREQAAAQLAEREKKHKAEINALIKTQRQHIAQLECNITCIYEARFK